MPVVDVGSRWRVYFFNLDTGAELDAFTWNGGGGAAERDGILLEDTVYTVEVQATRKSSRTITAADFPGVRVAVKIWHPDRRPDWLFLVAEGDPGLTRCLECDRRPVGRLGRDARKIPR